MVTARRWNDVGAFESKVPFTRARRNGVPGGLRAGRRSEATVGVNGRRGVRGGGRDDRNGGRLGRLARGDVEIGDRAAKRRMTDERGRGEGREGRKKKLDWRNGWQHEG